MILLEGGNDILRNVPHGQTRANLEQMIELATASGTQVLLLGVPEKSLFSNSAEFYSDLAEKTGVAFEPALLAPLLRKPSMKSDLVHLNAQGYRQLAEGIHDALRERGAL